RKTDGSPPVRVGAGFATALSPDGEWALVDDASYSGLILVPTKFGKPQRLVKAPLQDAHWATFRQPGNALLIAGNEPGHAVRLYLQTPPGPPRAISEEGINPVLGGMAASPDGKRVAAIGPGGRIALYPIEGGEPTRLDYLETGNVPVQWSEDGKSLFVF